MNNSDKSGEMSNTQENLKKDVINKCSNMIKEKSIQSDDNQVSNEEVLEKVSTVALVINENDYEQTTNKQEPLDAEPIDMSALSEGISVIEIVEMILNSRYVFRYNEVTGVMEFRSIWESEFKEFTDRELNSIHRILQKKKIKFSITNLNNLIFSNFSKRYNPFIEYFNSLPEWDNTTDYIYELANTVTTTNQELWQKCFKKWIIAATACVLYPDITNQTAIVFAGGQGIGKTTWMENLCPENLKRYMFSGTINPTNKDTVINLSECWFVNLDELENMNRTEIGTLKEIITKTNIRIRRPYGKISETLPRRASFMGSVNNSEFLNDPTGSRRFLCFEALEIEYQHNVDIDMVYSQALALYYAGAKFFFEKTEIAEITESNEYFQVHPFEEELLLAHFQPIEVENANTFMNASEVLAYLSGLAKFNLNNISVVTLGKYLKKHGFIKTKKKGLQVYAVKFITAAVAEIKPTLEEQTEIEADIPKLFWVR